MSGLGQQRKRSRTSRPGSFSQSRLGQQSNSGRSLRGWRGSQAGPCRGGVGVGGERRNLGPFLGDRCCRLKRVAFVSEETEALITCRRRARRARILKILAVLNPFRMELYRRGYRIGCLRNEMGFAKSSGDKHGLVREGTGRSTRAPSAAPSPIPRCTWFTRVDGEGQRSCPSPRLRKDVDAGGSRS